MWDAIVDLPPWLFVPLLAAFAIIALLVIISKVPVNYNLRNLSVRWKTTLMTALAFTLVVSLLVVMLAFVEGMNRLTEQSGQPGNIIVLSDGATDELFSNLQYGDAAEISLFPGVLRNGDDEPLCSREVYIVVTQPLAHPAPGKPNRRFVQVRGIENPQVASEVHGIGIEEGSEWFSDAGVRPLPGAKEGDSTQVIEAVLGPGAATKLGEDLGKESLEVGDVFTLGPRQWIVAGILRSGGSTFGSEIWAKREIVGPMFGKEIYTSIVLRTKNAGAASAVAKDLQTNFKKAALRALPETEYFSQLAETNKQFTVSIAFVTIVMAIGGVFGVMNTMFAAISQRTKDIGVLRILGYARREILVSFLLESLALALVGGVLGCAVGCLADGWTASSIVSSGPGGGGKSIVLTLHVSLQILAIGLLLTLLMGAIGGLIPALSAMRLRALESLR